MEWIPVAAWGAALLVAVVVLGFCGYEIVWKADRLRTDVRRLQEVGEQLSRLQSRLADAQRRVSAAGPR